MKSFQSAAIIRPFQLFFLLILSILNYTSVRAQYSFDGPKEITHMFYSINDLESADMDGNGLRDLVISTFNSYTRVVVKFQMSPGQFTDSLVFRNLPGFAGFSLHDVENDGDVDILLYTYESNTNPLANNSLLILANHGDGTFSEPIVSHFEDNFSSIRFFDWDLDGLLDVLFEKDDIIYLRKQTSSLILDPGQAIYQTTGLTNFAIADLDNDGDWDLVGTYYESATTLRKHFYTTQSAPLIFENLVVIAETSNSMRDWEFTDLNNDGYTDYIMTCTNGTGLFIFLNDGNGVLNYTTGSTGIWDGDIDIVDLDGDSYPDISAFELDGDEITFGYNNGTTITWQVFETSIYCTHGQIIDMDGDSDLDIYYGFYGSSGVQNLHFGLNPGNLNQVNWTVMNDSYYPVFSAAKVIDYNNDDLMDLVVNINTSAAVIENNGDGSFDEELLLPGTYDDTGSNLTVIDLNNDGFEDMISLRTNPTNNDVNFKTMIRSNTGLSYSPSWELESYHIWRYAVGDINGDGFPDLVFQEFPNYDLRKSFNQGDGTFGSASSIANLSDAAYLILIDANSDGFPDLLVDEAGQAKIYLNTTTGGFIAGSTFTSTTEIMLMGTDWDNDGLEDILSSDGNLYWRKNLGEAVFADRVALTSGLPVGGYTYQDMNADGFMDIIVANRTINPDSTAIYVFQNNGGTDLTVFPITKIPGEDYIVYAGDMDSDALPDLVFYDFEYREFYWWKNLGLVCENFQPTISSDQVLCPGENVTLQVTGADQVNWEYDHFGSEYTVSPDSTLVYQAVVRSEVGCTDTLSTTVSLAIIPEVQVLLNGSTLSASSGSNIQWFVVGNPEVVSNASGFEPQQSGFYFFISQSPDGCDQISDTLEFIHIGVNENESASLALFPNPGSDVLNISHGAASSVVEIFITDLQGRRVWTAERIQPSGNYTLPKSMASSSYVVTVVYHDGTRVMKVWMRE
jgi:hypothetical protein